MVQVPAVSSVAVEAEIVQTAGVVEVKLTGKPELAEAINATPTDVLTAWVGMAPKVIVWVARLVARLFRVHIPAINDEVVEAVHVMGVVAVRLTLLLASAATSEGPTMTLVDIVLPVAVTGFSCGPTPVPCK
jgi:hypothetical protein